MKCSRGLPDLTIDRVARPLDLLGTHHLRAPAVFIFGRPDAAEQPEPRTELALPAMLHARADEQTILGWTEPEGI
ncbi:MAG: hypothetical protein V1778_04645 [bacterium]